MCSTPSSTSRCRRLWYQSAFSSAAATTVRAHAFYMPSPLCPPSRQPSSPALRNHAAGPGDTGHRAWSSARPTGNARASAAHCCVTRSKSVSPGSSDTWWPSAPPQENSIAATRGPWPRQRSFTPGWRPPQYRWLSGLAVRCTTALPTPGSARQHRASAPALPAWRGRCVRRTAASESSRSAYRNSSESIRCSTSATIRSRACAGRTKAPTSSHPPFQQSTGPTSDCSGQRRSCATCARPTPRTPANAAPASGPTPSSRAGRSFARSAATRTAPPAWSRPSWSSSSLAEAKWKELTGSG